MGLILTSQKEIDKYFESDAINQSKLKKLINGFDSFVSDLMEEKDTNYKQKGHFIIGSAVDCILTGKEGDFEKKYYVSELEKKPSDVEMSIIKMLFDEITEKNDDIYDLYHYEKELMDCIIEHNWYNGKPGTKRINGLIERCFDYFEDLKLSYDKQIIDKTQKELIDNIIHSFKTNSRTSKYFDRSQLSIIKNVDIYYQLPIYFKYKDVDCKALLDLLIVFKDSKNKVISFQPIDIKTMSGNTLDFIDKVKYFRYDIQASWYIKALSNKNSSFNVNDKFNIDNVLIESFLFIVESNTKPGNPLLYKMSDNLIYIGEKGRPEYEILSKDKKFTYSICKKIVGFEELLEEYKYYDAVQWKEDMILEKNNEVLEIDWNGIK